MDKTWFPYGHLVVSMWTQCGYHMDTIWFSCGHHMVYMCLIFIISTSLELLIEVEKLPIFESL